MARKGAPLEPSMVCVKNLILCMNCLFVMTGLFLIAFGSTISGLYSNFDQLLRADMLSPAVFLIFVGSIVFIVSIFGCFGALRESTCLINMYVVSLIVIFIFEFSAGLAGFALQSTIKSTLSTNMRWAIKNQYAEPNTCMVDTIDTIQKALKCCGADSPLDWDGVLIDSNYTIGDDENSVIVPNSCCGNFDNPGVCSDPSTEGCLPTLVVLAHEGAVLLTAAAITVALIQAVGIYFANELAKAIRRAKSVRTLRQMELRNHLANSYQPMSIDTPVVYLADNVGDATA